VKRIIFWTCAAVGFSTTLFASQPSTPKIHGEFSVDLPDSIELNTPFQVTFQFETLESLYVDPEKPDIAILEGPENSVYLTGDTIWRGFLKVGESQSLTATYQIVEPKTCRFHGVLRTMGGLVPLLFSEHGKLYFKHINYAASRLIKFGKEEPLKMPVLTVTDTGLVATWVPRPPELDELARVNARIERADNWPDDSEAAFVQQIPIFLGKGIPDTVFVFYDSSVIYRFMPSGLADNVLVVLMSGYCEYQPISSRTGKFKLQSDSAFFKVYTNSRDHTLILRRPANACSGAP